jgi:hypothetical protein
MTQQQTLLGTKCIEQCTPPGVPGPVLESRAGVHRRREDLNRDADRAGHGAGGCFQAVGTTRTVVDERRPNGFVS